jgi:ADP-ribose pyrophosphatase YjhB (NUDIX family)
MPGVFPAKAEIQLFSAPVRGRELDFGHRGKTWWIGRKARRHRCGEGDHGMTISLDPTEPNAACVALIRDGDVLLIQRAFEPLKGFWTLPGGRREAGEAITETAIRELAEELALHVESLEPVLQMGVAGHFRLQVFATRSFAGEITPSAEIAAWRWGRPAALADLPTTPDLDRVLARVFDALGPEVPPQNH